MSTDIALAAGAGVFVSIASSDALRDSEREPPQLT
jgi:hypothetical protein